MLNLDETFSLYLQNLRSSHVATSSLAFLGVPLTLLQGSIRGSRAFVAVFDHAGQPSIGVVQVLFEDNYWALSK